MKNGRPISERDTMFLIKRLFYSLVIVCGLIGLCFSIIGWMKFQEQRVLLSITIYSCFVGIVIGIFELVKVPESKFAESYQITLGLLGGIALILAGLYLIFLTDILLFIKLITIFGIIFFSLGIIKGIRRISIEQNRIITVDLDYDDAFMKAKESLIEFNSKITKDSKKDGIIIAGTGLSLKSFGEILSLEFKKISDTQTQIRISSKPKIYTTMIDFGKNLENVEKLCKLLNRSFKS